MLTAVIVAVIILLCSLITVIAVIVRRGRQQFPSNTVGFLHPSAAAGGGGERVLWVAINALQQDDTERGIDRRYVLYCTSIGKKDNSSSSGSSNIGESKEEELAHIVYRQFQIRLQKPLEVIFLRREVTQWLDGNQYPFLTLILQAICGGVLLFYETCIVNNITPIVIESVGIPGIYPLLVLFAKVRIITYTHYPVITSIMTQRVESGEKRYNNRSILARYHILRKAKVLYYKLFARFYWWLGQFPVLVLTNSNWTKRHIEQMWKPKVSVLVYPPCAVSHLMKLRKSPEERSNTIVSVGQFRPEKNHLLQLTAFDKALPRLPTNARLIMVGGARSMEDQKRADDIVLEAKKRGISDRVEIRVGAPFAEVCELLSTCCIGLHTMEDEHFGIVLVEYIAAGCIPLGHNSGGVCLDIITSPDIGFLAKDENEYADRMVDIFEIKTHQPRVYEAFQDRGLNVIKRFSDESFREAFMKAIRHHLSA